jgi:hypothetical protein
MIYAIAVIALIGWVYNYWALGHAQATHGIDIVRIAVLTGTMEEIRGLARDVSNGSDTYKDIYILSKEAL